MDNYSKYLGFFKSGSTFEQLNFLDNFYDNDSVLELSNNEISYILFTGAENSPNVFVRRSCFKIICDLTLNGLLTNKFKTAGLLHDFLHTDDDELISIGLKYLPYFPEVFTDDTVELLKVFSDEQNAEISSQAYVCLGLRCISENITDCDKSQLIINLQNAERYFQAAFSSVENRDDAYFYILVIQWISGVISNDSDESGIKLEALEKSLMYRNLYENDGLELDFLIFKLINNIKNSYDILRISDEWINFRDSLSALMTAKSEIEVFRNYKGSSKSLIKQIDDNFFNKLESHIYKVHLENEKKRLNVLKSSDEQDLVKFIEKIISYFPDIDDPHEENYDLLISLNQIFGEQGKVIYQKIQNKEVTFEKAVLDLLKKNNNSKLPFKTGSIYGQEVFEHLTSQIDILLPNYSTDKMTAFLNIVEEVIRYARVTFIGHDKSHFSFLYSKSVKNGKGQDAVEQDLQDSMITFFEHSKIADGLGHEQARFVDGGRVDILYKRDIITVPIELKKSLFRPNESTLEENYLAQAQTYTAGYDQLGIFVLLELSDKEKEAPANFKDWFKIHHLKPSTNLAVDHPDFIISVIIPGNRTGPSSKSTYK